MSCFTECDNRFDAMTIADQDTFLLTLIEKSLIVMPDNMPEEYNGLSIIESIHTVKAKPERAMKPAEKKFINAYIQAAKKYMKEIIKAEKKQTKA